MTKLFRATVVALSAAIAAPALAQTAPAAPAGARPSNPGPVIAGVCILDEQRAIGASSAGRAYTARLQQLAQQVQAELKPQQAAAEADVRTFESQQAALTAEQRQTRGQAVQTRISTYQRLAQTRQAELQATQETQLRRIAAEMQPVVAQVYSARNCGLLLDGQSVAFSNPAMNITDQVVTGLNTRLPTLTFERTRAPAQAAAPAQGAARPAATAPATPR